MNLWLLIPLALFVGLPCAVLSGALFFEIARGIVTGDDGGTEVEKCWVMACLLSMPVIGIAYLFVV